MDRTLTLFVALSLSACAGPTVISTPNSCATLLPVEWKQGAANAFLSWVYAGKRILPGLMRRREAEKALYLGEA